MRNFIVYSSTASTSPNIRDLKGSGRIDILLHSIISALFASNDFRDDVQIHLFLMGPPNPGKRISIRYEEGNTVSKKDLKKLIEIALRKAKPGKTRNVHPGVYVDDKDIVDFIKENPQNNYFVLDKVGKHIKQYTKTQPQTLIHSPYFILGDHDGFEKQTKKYLKKNTNRLSLGDKVYFTSQAITIINYELDNLDD